MERIGILPRLGASLIDCVVLILFATIFGLVFGSPFVMGGLGYIAGLIFFGALLGYSYLEVLWAQTPGKKVLGLKIMNQDGSEASQDVLMKRWAIKQSGNLLNLLSAITTIGLFSFLGGIAGMVVAGGGLLILSADKLTLHDKLSQTSVFKPGEPKSS